MCACYCTTLYGHVHEDYQAINNTNFVHSRVETSVFWKVGSTCGEETNNANSNNSMQFFQVWRRLSTLTPIACRCRLLADFALRPGTPSSPPHPVTSLVLTQPYNMVLLNPVTIPPRFTSQLPTLIDALRIGFRAAAQSQGVFSHGGEKSGTMSATYVGRSLRHERDSKSRPSAIAISGSDYIIIESD